MIKEEISNPFYNARFRYELLGDRAGALTALNEALGQVIGTMPFHSFDQRFFPPHQYADRYITLESALSRLMFYPEAYGTTDYLNVPYADVFIALWTMAPDEVWIRNLMSKDFNKPSIHQLYIEPVPEEEYGDAESPQKLKDLFQTEALNGWLWTVENPDTPFGCIRISLDSIRVLVNDPDWRGLKVWMLDELPKFEPVVPKDGEFAFWQEMLQRDPVRLVRRGIELVFGDIGRAEGEIRINLEQMTLNLPFAQAFATAIRRLVDANPNAAHEMRMVAGLRKSDESKRWALEFANVLNGVSDRGSFLARCSRPLAIRR